MYLTIQQCYDAGLQYMEDSGVDIHYVTAIPKEMEVQFKRAIEPYWKAFQHSLRATLKKYDKHLPKLDGELVGELQAATSMTTSDLLVLFNQMLARSNA